MRDTYIEDKTFDKVNGKETPLAKGEYEHCTFNNCDLSNCNLSEIRFGRCTFINCNLSLAKLDGTALQDVTFKDSKLWGLRFDTCSDFALSFSFDRCSINHSSFYKLKLKKTTFKECQLHEVDFTDTDLTATIFDNCDLLGARFENTILEKANLRSAYNYALDPEINRIKKAKFSLPAVTGLLSKYDIDIQAS
jgi:uncharacterized protein YjbI with pentapeptide repeats